MKRIVLVFSLIAGIITAGMLFITMSLAKNGVLEPSTLLDMVLWYWPCLSYSRL